MVNSKGKNVFDKAEKNRVLSTIENQINNQMKK